MDATVKSPETGTRPQDASPDELAARLAALPPAEAAELLRHVSDSLAADALQRVVGVDVGPILDALDELDEALKEGGEQRSDKGARKVASWLSIWLLASCVASTLVRDWSAI